MYPLATKILSGVLFLLLSSQFIASDENEKKDCEGPPYIYATTHHEVRNILKYSRDGCLLSKDVLVGGGIEKENHFTELRAMVHGRYLGQHVLYIADAEPKNSSILVYGECDEHGQRKFITSIASTAEHPGFQHCYGLCFDRHYNLYASFQHTDNVLRFYKDTFKPMPLPPALQINEKTESHWRDYFAGTFTQFGQPNDHKPSEQGIRTIIIVHNNLWIANENIKGVAIISLDTGLMTNIIPLDNPIGLYLEPTTGYVFAGSKKKHWRGAVHSINPHTLQIVQTYSTGKMNHPTGITSYNDDLFVGEIVNGQILKFSISSGEFLGTVVDNPPGEIEQLLLSYC